MKKIVLAIICFTFPSLIYAQNLSLQNVVNKTYSETNAKVFNNNLCYIIPWEIAFIDTVQKSSDPIMIEFFKSSSSFKKYLDIKVNAFVLKIKVQSVKFNRMELTMSVSKANAQNYSDNIKLYTFVDERKVLLKYNTKSEKWVFDKVIEVLSDFNSTKN